MMMMNETGLRRILPEQYSGSGQTFGTSRHPSIIDPILSKRVCFYKSGDPQFNGLRLVINNRTFKTFDALLDSLSKKVPLPFGVRNITTPRGVHAINTLDELEDGKSYICSDSRKVKPINLALARKKLPPWYHARPVSSRRRTVQQARFFPGRSLHKQEQVLVRTPKRLLVFRNGDPTVKQTVVLNKKTTPSYESILEYISALMEFHVVKLHTPDGRRVDGVPGLILCSGTVVAVGREPFRPAIYSAQKSSAPKWLHTNRMAVRRQRALNLKKKSLSYSSKSRSFSPSSERYIIHQIHNTIAENSCEIPSNPTNSVEFESSRILESVAETEEDICLGDGSDRQTGSLPSEDDIEKSFRVNQDGSMTVEMKVRLTLKEEETIHWTTTLSRSSVASQLNAACLPEPEAEQEISSLKSTSLDLQSPTSSIDTINKDKTKDNDDEDPPSPSNGAFSESGTEEDEIKNHTDATSHTRAPTPGHKQIRTKEASVESLTSVTAGGIQEGMIGSYSYREQTANGTMTEQYCMIKQSSSRPVPKPRRLGSVDASNRNVSAFKSAGVMQIGSSGEEVTETVLHIYEQQTCQDNFLANVCAHSISASGITFARPATAETGQLSSSNEYEPELWRPSTASESINIWRAESVSVTSDLNLKSGLVEAAKKQQQFQKPTKGQIKPQEKRVSPKPKVINKHVRRALTPGKRQKENLTGATESRKKVRTPPTFSSAGFIKRIYGNKFKSAKTMKRLKKRQTQNRDVATNSLKVADDAIKSVVKDQNKPPALKENMTERASFESTRLGVVVNQPRGVLTRQPSMHMEKKCENESCDISESMSLPAFNSSTSVTKEYVENWLEKSHLIPQSDPNEDSKNLTNNVGCEESDREHDLITVEEKCLEACQPSESPPPPPPPPPENPLGTSVKLRVQSFEKNKSADKTSISQQTPHKDTTNTDNCRKLSQKNTEEIKPLSNDICSQRSLPTSKTSTEMPLDGEVEYKSTPVKISFQKATPTNTLSMELPPPPPELSDTEYCTSDASSVASSSFYRDSSLSSERTDNHPSSNSPTSDKAVSPTDSTTEITTSVHEDVPSMLREEPLPTTPSIKRAALVSNLSLEKKMFLRKACLDKYTLSGDVHSETLSAPISTVGDDELPNGLCLTETPQSIKAAPEETQRSISDLMGSPSCCTSVSPVSLPSEERVSSASVLSSEGSVHRNLQIKDSRTPSSALKEASSPITLVKKAKLPSSPSPERKFQMKKSSLELPNNHPKSSLLHIHRPDKNTSPNAGIQKHAAAQNAGTPTERKQKLYKPKVQKRSSPYSQSLDVGTLPSKNKSDRKLLSSNLSSDNPLEPTNNAQRKTLSQRKSHQTPQPVKPEPELDKTPTCGALLPPAADQREENKENQEKSLLDMQIIPQPLNNIDQPDMKPVLEKICFSIKSIRQMTQNKRPSCLEKSNSLPDFSSHVASTFGSSSKALLAFLSVMTLKEGMSNLNMDELNANNVSCAEALKMIDSLREIASIEDSHKLKTSLSNLQQSASKQLLQSWKGFQELSDKCKSRSSTPESLELLTEDGPEQDCGIEENVINEIMDSFDIPEELKEELASLGVGAKNDNEEKIIERLEMSSKDDTNHFPNEDDEASVDVRSIIKRFSHINQTKQPGIDNTHLMTDTVKHKPTDKATKDSNDQYSQNGETKNPPADPNHKQIPEERQLHSAAPFVQENGLDWQSCRDRLHQEHQEDSGENTTHKRANLEKEPEEQHVECRQLQTESEESTSIPENESEHDDKSDSEEEGQKTPSANKEESCEQTASSSEAGELQSSEEEEPEVACEEINQEKSETEDLSNLESHSDEEEDKKSGSNYVELNVREMKISPECENQSEEEEPELSSKDDSSKPACPSSSEKQQLGQTCSMGLNVSLEESTGNSDMDESSSEEEQPEGEFKELQVIVEESLSGIEDEEEEEEERLHNPPNDGVKTKQFGGLNALIEESEEDKDSSEDENLHANEAKISDKSSVGRELSNLIENQDSYTKKDSLIKSDSLGKHFRFNADDDSGNDHCSCEEHVEEEPPKVNEEHISSSLEEDLSYYDKESSSEEEQVNMEAYMEENRIEYHKSPALETQPEVTKHEKAVEKLKHHSEEVISQSVAERVSLLEKQVADAQKRKETTKSSPIRHFTQRNVPDESDEEDSPSDSPTESPTSQLALCTRSAPQSSLSFSYDSSGLITTEPEGNRVRSIREMFLAKSTTDMQERFPSQHEFRPETSVSGGYQSQTSSELSSGEDDSARKSITKGFVRRTIERLYGKKDAQPDEEAGERPPSEPKEKRKEHSSIFSPFHTARAKAMSELSYFNSTNALDTLSEATRCIAFNAQVGPGVPLDDGQWLLRDNTLIRKSVSDPVGINKTFTKTPKDEDVCKDTEENTPYSLFSTKPELEEKTKPLTRKCTYFSLPHGSDSDACQDDVSTVSKGSGNGSDCVIEAQDNSEDTKSWAERNGMLPGVGDFKIKDNKVHPLTEPPPDGEVVAVQPGKGYGVVNRRHPEPDVLDILYNFCGAHCPIL